MNGHAVVDASVLMPALADDGDTGDLVRAQLRRRSGLHAPDIVDLEVVSIVRRLHRTRDLGGHRAAAAVEALRMMRVRRHRHVALLPRVWQLRHNLTPYDAAYVALAEALDCVLVTADHAIAGTPNIRCDVEVFSDVAS